MLDAIPFWYLRHGQTEWNTRNLAQGATNNPLNETGLAQARTAADLLVGRGISTIVASPYLRARETAEIVAARLDLPVTYMDDLHEANFGSMEGEMMLAQWFEDWLTGTTPDGAESFVALRRRAAGAINQALANPSPVLVIAHGALFRAVRAEMGLAANVRLGNALPNFCEPPQAGQSAWTLTEATSNAAPAATPPRTPTA